MDRAKIVEAAIEGPFSKIVEIADQAVAEWLATDPLKDLKKEIHRGLNAKKTQLIADAMGLQVTGKSFTISTWRDEGKQAKERINDLADAVFRAWLEKNVAPTVEKLLEQRGPELLQIYQRELMDRMQSKVRTMANEDAAKTLQVYLARATQQAVEKNLETSLKQL